MNAQISEEAAEWVVRNRDASLDYESKRRFDEWLRESPQHVLAYLELSAIWDDVGGLDSTSNQSSADLISIARNASNVISLDESEKEHGAPPRLKERRAAPPQVRRIAMVRIGLAASLLIALFAIWRFGERDTYSTGVGEQRSIVLDDGSRITINSRSRLRVRYTRDVRRVELLHGQALFDVAKQVGRPFEVRSGEIRVRAVGTQFDVYRRISSTVVTVVEGKVAMVPPLGATATRGERAETMSAVTSNSPGSAVLVAAGEQVVVGPKFPSLPRAANVAAAIAWTQRALVFDSSPLPEVAEEFNRYNSKQLVVVDDALASFSISGVFSSVDPDVFVRFLHSQPELRIEESQHEIRISRQ